MSKSKGNYIGITDSPQDMFGKVMSIPDGLMSNYFTLLTDLDPRKIDELVDSNRTHPRQAKATLGSMIVSQYYGADAGEAASAEFDRIFSRKQAPTDMPEVRVAVGKINIVDLIMQASFAASKSDARRLVAQKAVSIDDQAVTDINATVEPRTGAVLRVGKRRFGKIVAG
jgi:tyrosyl-tRNA synthetase